MTTTTSVPTGKLDLWEYGRRKLGYGCYTPDLGPYPKWAAMECHKLYLTMRKRRITNAEFVLCVDYCHAMRIRIENPVWVFKELADARAWKASDHTTDLTQRINDAIERERALAAEDSGDWVTRLARAQGPYREEVLVTWEQHRLQSTAP